MNRLEAFTQLVERENRATDEAARRLRERGWPVSGWRLRYELLIHPLQLFLVSYVVRGGQRQGLRGLVDGALAAWLHFLTWAKAWALGLSLEQPVPTPAANGRRNRTSDVGLTIVVLTKNEEVRLGRCLESIRWADEIIVVDGGSTDRTVEIARSYGATVITHAFEGSFATERNLGLQHAKGEWVLQMDADDVATPEFRDAILAMIRSHPPHGGYKFRRRSVLLGRVMRHGGWHYYVPNLTRREGSRYEGLVHERSVVQGTVGVLHADIEHHACTDLSVFTARQNRYTTLQAEDAFRECGRLPERRIRRLLWKRPWKVFWKSYVKKAGWREGLHGLVFAAFYAGVDFLKWAKYWERCQQEDPSA
jgi:hypothetical protein